MTDQERINKLVTDLADVKHETPCESSTCDDCFDEERERCMAFVSIAADGFNETLGGHFAREVAMISLLGDIHANDGTAGCLATIKELLSALQAWEQNPIQPPTLKLVS